MAETQDEKLYALCQAANVEMNPEVFTKILDLIRLNVSPLAIVRLIKTISLRLQEQQQAGVG
eukprot:m.83244 g.83244  ORF g.83244 m.83244 type:complete len:62 (-) comp12910_c0_seq1:1733-1918(-)